MVEEIGGGQPVRWAALEALFSPSSVAVVGASDDPRKWGCWLARAALRGEHRRRVVLVNRRAPVVLGRPAHRRLRQAPGGAELAVLAVPATSFEDAVEDALAAGAKAIVGLSAGLGEAGPEGQRREREVVARVREAGAVLLGPNCLGLADVAAELDLASNPLPPGPVGLISQSGNLALEIGLRAEEVGLGIARFASVGNQADLEVADLLASFAAAEHVRAIAVYCEDFRGGRRFLEAAERAGERGKPVVLVTVGASPGAARAARSHTGALVSGQLSIDAACRAVGVERVATPQQLADLLQGLLSVPLPGGPRTAVLADGGGHGALAADVATAAGLAVPRFSAELEGALGTAIGTGGTTANPIDLAGAGEQDIWSFARAVRTVVDSPEADAVLLTGYFGGYGTYGAELASAELEVAAALAKEAAAGGKPVVVHAMHATSEPLAALRQGGVPVYRTIEAAAWTLGRLVRRASEPRQGLPQLPPPRPGPESEGYWAARELLVGAGVAMPGARAVTSVEEAARAAGDIGYPVVLKAAGAEHKSDVGGVVLGLADGPSVRSAAADLWSRLGPAPLAVEAMVSAPGGVELLVGVHRDARFGPVAVVGMGGVHAELFADVAAALAPVDEATAKRMLCSLRAAPLLQGARGRLPIDLVPILRVVVGVSQVAASHPAVAALEVNPLLAGPEGAWGLDARLVLDRSDDHGRGEAPWI